MLRPSTEGVVVTIIACCPQTIRCSFGNPERQSLDAAPRRRALRGPSAHASLKGDGDELLGFHHELHG